MKLNLEMAKSLFFKALPILLAFLAGKGLIPADATESVTALTANTAELVTSGATIVAAWITFARSVKTHKAK